MSYKGMGSYLPSKPEYADPDEYSAGRMRHEFEAIHEVLGIHVPKPKWGEPFQMRIKPGCYNVDEEFITEGRMPNPTVLNIKSDEIYVMQDDRSRDLHEKIHRHWSPEFRRYCKEQRILHKSAIIIPGPPGSGKSTFLKSEIKNLVEQGQIVFMAESPYSLKRAMHAFRKMEPKRDLTVVLEDIDEITKSWGENVILQLVDGKDAIDHVLFLATTNDMDCLSHKMKRRGRFGERVDFPNPDEGQRQFYLENALRGREDKENIRSIARMTEGFNFGDLRDIVTSVYGHRENLQETIRRIKTEGSDEIRSGVKNGRSGPSMAMKCTDGGWG